MSECIGWKSTRRTSNMNLQVCHCGWSKTTTYQGLRTHQGKMGCTAKGMSIPQSEYLSLNSSLKGNLGLPKFDLYSPIKAAEPLPDTSLQVCHCGWSKETTYHGLRTHQGMMGCTMKGLRIPESKPFNFDSSVWELGLNDVSTPFNAELSFQVCHCGWSKVTTYQGLRTHQGKMGCTLEEGALFPNTFHLIDEKEGVKTDSGLPSFSTPTDFAAATVKEEHKSLFETPQHSVQMPPNFHVVRRALDFSDQQNETIQTHQVATEKEELRSFSDTLQQSNDMVQKVKAAQQVDSSSEYQQERQDRITADLQLKLQMIKQKKAEVKSSVKAFKCNLDREWLEINSVFSDAMKVMEEAREKALQPLEERKAKAKKEARELMQQLQEEIDKLTKAISNSDTNFQVSPSLMTATFDTSCSFGTLRVTTSTMMEQIEQNLEKLSSVELKRFHRFEVDVKLDPSTAHRQLLLSADGKEVSDGGESQEVSDTLERFDLYGSILGVNSLVSGKSYWEVAAGDKTGWDMGVARGNAKRTGKLSLNPDGGYWVVVHYNDDKYAAMAEPPVGLTLSEKPDRVGVFVDKDKGLVSFYDVTAQSHIHSFTGCSFSDTEIFPYFSPHLRENGRNAEPLIICAVTR
ncbi:uncharacterized protein LOC143010264 isoform X3 [Genypterus blacodes]|uniref:uncharacterized protein LOC143010264 isoform X3 n=1 Tax=Genypterus blacodes TaxID=154954 RepID=UPI003F778300